MPWYVLNISDRVGSLSGYLSSGMFLCFNFFSNGPLFVLGTSTSFVF